MEESLPNFRKAQNEVIFRQHNEHIERLREQHHAIAREDGQPAFMHEDDEPLHFYCECADENCRERVSMRPNLYKKIHKHRDRFVLIPGHEDKRIEHIVEHKPEFYVVEKYVFPPQAAAGLKRTDTKN
jgi:hypothetical protein